MKKILVIDDDKKFSFGLVAVLRRAGYLVVTAYNGEEGLAMAKAEKPDIILCDIMMPPPNGIELKKNLRDDSDLSKVPFLFLTARTAQVDKLTSFEIGADDYITKPFDVNELLARIQAVLRREELGRERGVQFSSNELDKLRSSISTNLSHELRTPLTVLLSTLDLVLQEKFIKDNAELNEYVSRANTSAHRLKFLVEDLEMLHAIDRGEINNLHQTIDLRFHLREPIEQTIKNWEKKSLTIKLMINPQLVIYAPRIEFSHVVAHLVDNACKFSPKNGTVVISIQPNGLGGCVVEVVDQGLGIPPELREKVFERYFQASQGDSREFDGLGIGLTLAHAFAQSMKGEIQILDSPNGCRVRLSLPPYKLD